MAKRIQFAAYGGPEVLEYRDYQPAEPGPWEVRVRNRAIGLNFIDTYYRSGLYPAPGFPSGLGSEGRRGRGGGQRSDPFQVGDRVATPPARWAPTANCMCWRRRSWSTCPTASTSNRPPR